MNNNITSYRCGFIETREPDSFPLTAIRHPQSVIICGWVAWKHFNLTPDECEALIAHNREVGNARGVPKTMSNKKHCHGPCRLVADCVAKRRRKEAVELDFEVASPCYVPTVQRNPLRSA
jgi:hypothetical protein